MRKTAHGGDLTVVFGVWRLLVNASLPTSFGTIESLRRPLSKRTKALACYQSQSQLEAAYGYRDESWIDCALHGRDVARRWTEVRS